MEVQPTQRKPIQGALKVFVIIGFILLLLSLLSYWGDRLFAMFEQSISMRDYLFLFSGLITYGYFLTVIIYGFVNHGLRLWRLDSRLFHIAIVLFGIFAFAVNKTILAGEEIIGKQPLWVEVLVFLSFGGILLDIFREKLSDGIRLVQMVLSGFGTLFALYFGLLMLPILPLGILAFFFFGLPLVVTSPFWVLLAFFRVYKNNKGFSRRVSFWTGLGVPLLFVIFYTFQWAGVSRDIQKGIVLAEQSETDYPKWLAIAQHIQDRPFLHSIIKHSQPSFSGSDFGLFNFFDSPPRRNMEANPLAVIGHFFVGPTGISYKELANVGGALMDLRYESEPRLWSDADLKTARIETNIEVFADYRLAYVEKKIQIHRSGGDFGGNPREAIYTFHLPEGGCATSLSLWINGKEEKARMDSKEKTTEAYETIVGVERRDPSLVTWMEGNALMVRVFPVTEMEDREFKLGMTIPMAYKAGNLELPAVYFEGPDFRGAPEQVHIAFRGAVPAIISGTEKLVAGKDGILEGERSYVQDRSLVVKAPDLASDRFVFDRLAWHLEPLKTTEQDFRPAGIALDIDRNWTKKMFNEYVDWAFAQNLKVWAFTSEMVELNPENRNAVFAEVGRIRFSIFPFYLLPDPEHTVVVTQSTLQSPGWSALEESIFSGEMEFFVDEHAPVRVFHIGSELSPYLRSLKEVRAIDYQSGTWDSLKSLIGKGKYPFVAENDGQIANHISGVQIVQDSAVMGEKSSAPDHLMRLFTYNHVIQQIGIDGLVNALSDADLVAEARRAFVVTPFTKLVVLESKADYDSFDILDNEGTLGNSGGLGSVFGSGDGSVPEPHEWALIALTVLIAGWLYRKRKLTKLHG